MAVKKKVNVKAAPKRAGRNKAAEASRQAPAAAGKGKGRVVAMIVVAAIALFAFQILVVARRQAAQKIDLVHIGGLIQAGLGSGQVMAARAIVGDKDGNVFFMEHPNTGTNFRFQKFNKGLQVQGIYKPRKPEDMFVGANSMDVDVDGRPWVLEDHGRIHILDNDLKPEQIIQLKETDTTAMAANPAGGMYVASRDGNKIVMVDADGNPAGEFGAPGTNTGDVANPKRLASDTAGNLYVLEGLPGDVVHIKVFDKAHKMQHQYNLKDFVLNEPDDMAVDNLGHLILNDASADKGVAIFDAAKGRLYASSKSTQDAMAIISPGALGVNRYTGTLYVNFGPGMICCVLPVPSEK